MGVLTTDRGAGLTDRGRVLMEAARIPIARLVQGLDEGLQFEPDIVALELGNALAPLEEITGERFDEGILERVFERFCVGK